MAKKGNHKFDAMRRQQDRQKRAAEKRERRRARAENKPRQGGNDSDLFVPGPGWAPNADASEVEDAVQRAMHPGRIGADTRRRAPAKAAAARLFIGNLDANTGDDSLRRHFTNAGYTVVSASVVTDRQTGRSRGFAFVELDDEKSAKRAIEQLDGSECDGSSLRVRAANER